MRCWTLLALLAIGAAHAVSAAQAPAEPPVRAAPLTPRFEADTSQVPDLQPWGRAA